MIQIDIDGTNDEVLNISNFNPVAMIKQTQCLRRSPMGQLATEVLQLRNQVTTLTSLLDTEKRKNLRPLIANNTTQLGSRSEFEKFMINHARNMTEELRFRFLFGKWKRHSEATNFGDTSPDAVLTEDDIPDVVRNAIRPPITEIKPGKRRVRLLRQDKVVRVALKSIATGKPVTGTEGKCVAMALDNPKLHWVQFDHGNQRWQHEDELVWGLPGTDLGKNPTRMLRGRTDG
jgi:hypothetical protein